MNICPADGWWVIVIVDHDIAARRVLFWESDGSARHGIVNEGAN
jgi:hypothetical protein